MFWLFGLLTFIEVGAVSPNSLQTTYICPKDFYAIGEKCYYFSKDAVMWSDSHFACQMKNSSLTILNSHREQNLLREYVRNNISLDFQNSERWIDGIYDWQQKRWKWGATGTLISFNAFSKRNIGDQHKWNCVALNGPRSNKWVSRKCTEKKPFICQTDSNFYVQFKLKKRKTFDVSKCSAGEKLDKLMKNKCMKLLGKGRHNNPAAFAFRPKPTRDAELAWVCPPNMVGLGNRCYYFSLTATTWMDAHFKCRQNKTKLAVIRNKAQDNNLRRFLNNYIEKSDRWIDGIFDWRSHQWRWAMTGQPLKYVGFAEEVTRNRNSEDFEWGSIFMDPKLDNRWNMDKQTLKKRYICQVKAKAVKKLGSDNNQPSKATIYIVSKSTNP